MADLEPITREESFLNGTDLEPITRKEHFYAGKENELPEGHREPKTREEWFIKKYREAGDVTVESLSVTENGTYTASEGKAYSPVSVDVQPTLISKSITANGDYSASSDNADGYSSVSVNVPLPENAYLLKEIENTEIATFTDGSDLPMPKLEVAIEPVQSGSGDPSPTNIRPISGWDEVNVSVCGVNVWDEEWELGEYNTNTGANYPNNNRIRTKNFVPVLPSTTYYYKCSNASQLLGYDINKNYIGTISHTSDATFTTQNNCYYIKFSPSADYGTTYNNDISINYPSTDTSYHTYNGTTYTIDLDGTRYGGTLDVVSGVLTVDRAYVVYDGSNDEGITAYNTSLGVYYLDAISDMEDYIDTSLPPNIVTNYLKPVSQSSSWGVPNIISQDRGAQKILIGSPNFGDSVEACRSYLSTNNLQLLYKLATPTTIQLTPTQVKSLVGNNNAWCNTGKILNGEYFSKTE